MRFTTILTMCLICSVHVGAASTGIAVPPSTPAPKVAPGAVTTPPPSFDPSLFVPLTTATLPLDNGHPVVMRVNGRAVSWDDFTILARMIGAAVMAEHPGKEQNIMAAFAGPVTEGLIQQELYREFAQKNALQVQPAEIERNYAKIKNSVAPSVKQTARLLTEPQIRQHVTDGLLREKVDKLIGDNATSVSPTMQEVTSFTTTMMAAPSPVQITRASHIVIRATPDMSQFNINDAKARAEEALAKIRSGLDFAAAARQYSQDRFTAYQGGNIGYYTTGTMFQEFEAAAAKLAPGEVSEVIRTPVGYNIIQVTERHPNDLRLQLDKYKRQTAVQQWIEQAARAAKVERFVKY